MPTHLEERAVAWLDRNKDRMGNYLQYNNENLNWFISPNLPGIPHPGYGQPQYAADWIYGRRYSLAYFLVGRDGPYSDELRDLMDIVHLAKKVKN